MHLFESILFFNLIFTCVFHLYNLHEHCANICTLYEFFWLLCMSFLVTLNEFFRLLWKSFLGYFK